MGSIHPLGGGLNSWTSVSCGRTHSLGIAGGKLYSWGRGNSGQLGLGTYTDKSQPTRVGTLTTWSNIAAGWVHNLASI